MFTRSKINAILITLLFINMPVMATSQSKSIYDMLKKEGMNPTPYHCYGTCGKERNICKGMTAEEWKEYKEEEKAEYERIRRAKWIEQDMYSCMGYQKKYKDIYWDSKTNMCKFPEHSGADAIIDIYPNGSGGYSGFIYK
ncbi:MAG: hypothetical protein ACI37Q_09115 [Candidatus Gastranaerophilaceae bacterium]